MSSVVPFHRLPEAPPADVPVLTTVRERLALAEDEFDEVETQVTEIPSLLVPPPPPADTDRLGFYAAGGWTASLPVARDSERTLAVVRGAPVGGRDSRALRQLSRVLGRSHVVAVSAAEAGDRVFDVRLAQFERLGIETASASVAVGGDPEGPGRKVAQQLRQRPGLVAVLALAASPPQALTRHRAAMQVVLGDVAVALVHAAGTDGDPAWVYDGTRLADAMLVAVGLYREGIAPVPAREVPAELEAFWALARRLDAPEVASSAPVALAPPPPPPRPAPVPSPNASGGTPVPVIERPAAPEGPFSLEAHRQELAARQRPGGGGLDVRLRTVDGIAVLTLSGPLDGTLDPAKLLPDLGGVTLVDLDGVEAVLPEGVAAWAPLAQAGAMYLARCSEAVVAEGAPLWATARVLSLFAPYRCRACGTAFSALYDTRDPRVLEQLGQAAVACAVCGEPAVLDGDPERYAPIASRAAAGAPSVVVDIARGLPMREAPEPSAPRAPPPPPAPAGPAALPPVLVALGGWRWWR
ncbi:MAG: hypothetical protein R3F59_02665 [Myxococcota bacterium]